MPWWCYQGGCPVGDLGKSGLRSMRFARITHACPGCKCSAGLVSASPLALTLVRRHLWLAEVDYVLCARSGSPCSEALECIANQRGGEGGWGQSALSSLGSGRELCSHFSPSSHLAAPDMQCVWAVCQPEAAPPVRQQYSSAPTPPGCTGISHKAWLVACMQLST